MNAGYLKARQAFAAFDVQKTGVFGAAGLTKETFHTTTIPCRQTASVTLCAPVEPAAGIRNTRLKKDLSPDIPYSLLAFYPQFYLNDLPTTSKSHALRCKAAAENAGLRRVHIGNLHLLRN
jgi:hypothetical protein